MNQPINEKTSKIKNILHHLYTILCYILYIAFIIVTGKTLIIYTRNITYTYIAYLPRDIHMFYLLEIISCIPIVICSAIFIFKSIKAIINKTFYLYRIIINFLIILSLHLLVVTFFHSCSCEASLSFAMAISSFLLIPLMMAINNLIKKRRNITSTSKIIINRILIGVISIISLYLIVGFIVNATTDPHKFGPKTNTNTITSQ